AKTGDVHRSASQQTEKAQSGGIRKKSHQGDGVEDGVLGRGGVHTHGSSNSSMNDTGHPGSAATATPAPRVQPRPLPVPHFRPEILQAGATESREPVAASPHASIPTVLEASFIQESAPDDGRDN